MTATNVGTARLERGKLRRVSNIAPAELGERERKKLPPTARPAIYFIISKAIVPSLDIMNTSRGIAAMRPWHVMVEVWKTEIEMVQGLSRKPVPRLSSIGTTRFSRCYQSRDLATPFGK